MEAAPPPKRQLIPPLITLVILKVVALEERPAKVADLDAEIGEQEYVPATQVAGQNTARVDVAERSGDVERYPQPDAEWGRIL